MKEIIGVIFPIPKQFVDRLLVDNRNVFVKYVPRITGLKIVPKDKVLFYASHSSKEIVGEGKIDEMLFLTPEEALQKYGERMFLNEKELSEYTLQQPRRDSQKKMLVLVLSGIRRYSEPRKLKKPITMAGQYLTREEYKRILS